MLFFKHPKVVPTLKLLINGNPIEQVTNFNFLGITIDQNITWSDHITKISIKFGILYSCNIRQRRQRRRWVYLTAMSHPMPYFEKYYYYLNVLVKHFQYCKARTRNATSF